MLTSTFDDDLSTPAEARTGTLEDGAFVYRRIGARDRKPAWVAPTVAVAALAVIGGAVLLTPSGADRSDGGELAIAQAPRTTPMATPAPLAASGQETATVSASADPAPAIAAPAAAAAPRPTTRGPVQTARSEPSPLMPDETVTSAPVATEAPTFPEPAVAAPAVQPSFESAPAQPTLDAPPTPTGPDADPAPAADPAPIPDPAPVL